MMVPCGHYTRGITASICSTAYHREKGVASGTHRILSVMCQSMVRELGRGFSDGASTAQRDSHRSSWPPKWEGEWIRYFFTRRRRRRGFFKKGSPGHWGGQTLREAAASGAKSGLVAFPGEIGLRTSPVCAFENTYTLTYTVRAECWLVIQREFESENTQCLSVLGCSSHVQVDLDGIRYE